MIQPLRRAHQWIWLLLAVLLGTIYACGLWVRRSTTPQNPGVRWEQYK